MGCASVALFFARREGKTAAAGFLLRKRAPGDDKFTSFPRLMIRRESILREKGGHVVEGIRLSEGGGRLIYGGGMNLYRNRRAGCERGS